MAAAVAFLASAEAGYVTGTVIPVRRRISVKAESLFETEQLQAHGVELRIRALRCELQQLDVRPRHAERPGKR